MKYLVFLHGWGATGEVWRTQLALSQRLGLWLLASGLNSTREHFPPPDDRPLVLSPDIHRWQPPWLAEWLAGLPLGETVVVGWSLGGMLLLETLVDTGWQPAAVILVATPASFCQRPDYPLGQPPAMVRAMRQRVRRDAGGVLRDFALHCLAPGEEQFALAITSFFTFRASRQTHLLEGLDYLLTKDLRPKLAQAPAGIALLQGGIDQIVDVPQAFFLHQHLPGSRLFLLPGAGHAPFLTQPEAFHTILRQIISGS